VAEPIRSFVFTAHCLTELRRREIPAAAVRQLLAAPEQRLSVREGRVVLQSRAQLGGRPYLLRVVVDIAREPAEVVTAYRTRRIDKYWRQDA